MATLIVGLGNPGSEYAGTRHNIGFAVVEKFLERRGADRFEERHTCQSLSYFGRFRGKKLILQKPLTFMNLSGEAVGLMCRREKIPPEDVLVICDDMDLPFGELRLRPKGSSGGHNGLKSIIETLGSESFARLRFGVGRPEREDAVDHVLGRFDEADRTLLALLVEKACDAVECVLRAGIERAMNDCNRKFDLESV